MCFEELFVIENMSKKSFHSKITSVAVFFLLLCFYSVVKGQTCGGFVEAKLEDTSTQSGTIKSPNYPSAYTNQLNCIWLIQAPANYTVKLDLSTGFLGQSDCGDYLDIRNGNAFETQFYYSCLNSTAATVQSVQRWLWLRFFSDDSTTNTGFSASWSIIYDNATVDYVSPITDCQSVNYSCPNKECVSWSYRCDGQMDCGCDASGCDETNCGGLGLSTGSTIGIGITVGTATFCIIFFGIGFFEITMKKRGEKDYQRKVKEAKLRAKQKRNKGEGDIKRQESVSDRSRPSTATPSRRPSQFSQTGTKAGK